MTASAEPGDYYQPWSVRGCTFEVAHRTPCGSQDTVHVDGFNGRRCAEHAPRFDPERAVTLALTDRGAAFMYAAAQWPEDGV